MAGGANRGQWQWKAIGAQTVTDRGRVVNGGGCAFSRIFGKSTENLRFGSGSAGGFHLGIRGRVRQPERSCDETRLPQQCCEKSLPTVGGSRTRKDCCT